jgi:6-pyruvoyltetrahydropterin/6-carboxytetrahydropterin synthase
VDEVASGHLLPGYEGPCSVPHGHNWSFEAVIGADELADDMVVDFSLVKRVFRQFDHTMLNDHPGLMQFARRPTTERLAAFVAQELQTILDTLPNRPRLLSVTAEETSRNKVVFRP